jgi:hypothetical protein
MLGLWLELGLGIGLRFGIWAYFSSLFVSFQRVLTGLLIVSVAVSYCHCNNHVRVINN